MNRKAMRSFLAQPYDFSDANRLKTVLMLAPLVLALVESFSYLNIYSDMSYKLVTALMNRGVTPVEDSRQFLFYFRDLPLYLGIACGVSDIAVLIKLHGLGFFLSSAFFWTYALFRLRNDILFWPFFGLFSVCYLPCHLGGGAESVFLNALFVVCSAVMMQSDDISAVDVAVYFLACVLMTHTYELIIMFAPVVVLVSLRRVYVDTRMGAFKKIVIVLCVPLLAYAFFPAVLWINILKPHAKSSMHHIGDVLRYQSFGGGVALLLMFLAACAVSLSRRQRMAYVFVSCVFLALVLFDANWSVLPYQFFVRFYNSLTLLISLSAVFVIMAARSRRGKAFMSKPLRWEVVFPVLVVFVVFFARSVCMAGVHYSYVADIRNIVNAHSGVVSVDSFQLASRRNFDWSWNFPLISILIRADSSKAILANSSAHKGWQPFDPYQPDNVPNLDKYYRK